MYNKFKKSFLLLLLFSSTNLFPQQKYNLYEVTQSSYSAILNTPLDPSVLQFYPLQVGNKWIYSGMYRTYPSNINGLKYVREITDKKTLPNNKIYYKIREYEKYGQILPETFYERIDSLNGRIYRYNPDSVNTGYEYLIDDLLAGKNDSLQSYRFKHYVSPTVMINSGDTTLFSNKVSYKEFDIPDFPTSYKYILARNFGLMSVSSEDDNRLYDYLLNGAVINGQLYGDTTLTGIEKIDATPKEFLLGQNYPNPFNPVTTINYEIPKQGFVRLKIYDLLGREVKILVNEEKPAGSYKVTFDASGYSSGIYFYELTTGNFTSVKKMVLLR